MHLWVKKLNLFIFTYVPKQKSLPGYYHYHCRQEEVNHLPQTISAEREEDYGAEKITKIKFVKVLAIGFDKFHHFCNLYIFGLCSYAKLKSLALHFLLF